MWEAYQRETGCELEMEAVPMDLPGLHEAILGKDGLKNGDWDIALVNTDWIAEAHADEAVEDLGPYLGANPPDDYPQGWPDSLLGLQQFGEQTLGLPFHDGPECLIYRKDLFEDPQERQRYEQRFGRPLRPPETWDDFRSTASFFHRPECSLYGAVFATYPDGHNTVFDFCLQVWTRGGELTGPDGQVRIDTPAARAGMAFYREILGDRQAVHPDCAGFESVKAGMAFARGEAAMMVNWFGFAAFCEVDRESMVKGKVDITHVPRGNGGENASLNVYWMYTIGSGSRHKQEAYDFIRFALSKANDKLLTLEGGIGCRISTWKDEEINKTVPYYYRLEELHQKARTLPRVPGWSGVASVIDKVVLEVMNSITPVEEILKKGQDKL